MPLVRRLGSLREALYIEQTLEKHLRIVDEPVPGEVGRESL
jgi:hypothetical protein